MAKAYSRPAMAVTRQGKQNERKRVIQEKVHRILHAHVDFHASKTVLTG